MARGHAEQDTRVLSNQIFDQTLSTEQAGHDGQLDMSINGFLVPSCSELTLGTDRKIPSPDDPERPSPRRHRLFLLLLHLRHRLRYLSPLSPPRAALAFFIACSSSTGVLEKLLSRASSSGSCAVECNDKPKVVLLEPEIKHGFPYAEIVKITNNFEKVIGEGGSGNLYYGRLKNGCELVVKVLKNSLSQGNKELLEKVKLQVTVHHKCLVPFVGYCEEGGRLILLYENMSGVGSKTAALRCWKKKGKASTSAFLTWSSRLQDALSVAAGPSSPLFPSGSPLVLSILPRLEYLHSGCNPPIIHREFCRYYRTNLVTKKSDVYSFGVVFFGLMTRYPPVFDVSGEPFHIVNVADLKLRGQYDVNSIWKVADIAMSCTSQPSHSRPHMSDVLNQLKEAVETESYYEQTDTSSTEVQDSSSFSYEFSSSFLSTSYLPQAR
ncbi:hypothetical protein EJ110_NYTH19450 [Nymphaea thermarum]|nr:hypothetical protein EJ110_NYTH19450 [Nymphaea thermarum]